MLIAYNLSHSFFLISDWIKDWLLCSTTSCFIITLKMSAPPSGIWSQLLSHCVWTLWRRCCCSSLVLQTRSGSMCSWRPPWLQIMWFWLRKSWPSTPRTTTRLQPNSGSDMTHRASQLRSIHTHVRLRFSSSCLLFHCFSLQLYPGQLDKSVTHVILHVQSAEINQHLSVPVSRSNGFLFIQTDKPLYTPHQRGESVVHNSRPYTTNPQCPTMHCTPLTV